MKHGQFLAVRSQGKRTRTEHLQAAAIPNQDGQFAVGFSVRGLKSAVIRNKIRRRLQAAVRQQQGCAINLVITADGQIAALPFPNLLDEIQQIVERLCPN